MVDRRSSGTRSLHFMRHLYIAEEGTDNVEIQVVILQWHVEWVAFRKIRKSKLQQPRCVFSPWTVRPPKYAIESCSNGHIQICQPIPFASNSSLK